MTLSSVTSGFDLEITAGSALVRHLLQLLMDVGDLPATLPLAGNFSATLYANNTVRRTYPAYPGADHAVSNPTTFGFKAWDFGDFDSDYAYFSINTSADLLGSESKLDLYFKILKDIDVQSEIAAILEYVDREVEVDGAVRPYDILRLFKLETVMASGDAFDTEHPERNNPGIWQPVVDIVNQGLEDFIRALRAGEEPEAVEFLRSQLDPLTLGALERVAVKCHPERNVLGIYVNFRLLAHKEGWLGPRGSLDAARDFLPDGVDFAAGTSPDFSSHLVDDLLIKSVVGFQLEEDLLTESEALDILDGDHFPLDVPKEMVYGENDKQGDGKGAIRFQVKDTALATTRHAFKDAEGNKTEADSLEVKLKTSASLAKALGLASENIVAYLTPLDGSTEGIPTADVGLDTDLRVDLFRTLVSLLNPLNLLKVVALPIVGVINLFVNGSDPFAGVKLSEMGVDLLSRLTLRSLRWDPFYTTEHGFLLEKKEFLFDRDRLFLSGLVHLSKTFAPYETVWVREALAAGPGGVQALLYHVDKPEEILADSFFATDREAYAFEAEDREKDIYRLEYLNTGGRLAAGKLAVYIPYTPYSTRQDDHEGHHHIDAIRMLHPREADRIEDDLLDDWAEAQAEALMADLEAAGVEFKKRQRDDVEDILEDFVRDSGGYAAQASLGLPDNLETKVSDPAEARRIQQALLDEWVSSKAQTAIAELEAAGVKFTPETRRDSERILEAYVRGGTYDAYVETQLPLELSQAIYAPGTLRLALSPVQLDELRTAKILDLFGYAKVVREGHLYFRDIADKSTKDNLLSLPEYS